MSDSEELALEETVDDLSKTVKRLARDHIFLSNESILQRQIINDLLHNPENQDKFVEKRFKDRRNWPLKWRNSGYVEPFSAEAQGTVLHTIWDRNLNGRVVYALPTDIRDFEYIVGSYGVSS